MSFIDSLGQNNTQQASGENSGGFINNLGNQNQLGTLPKPQSTFDKVMGVAGNVASGVARSIPVVNTLMGASDLAKVFGVSPSKAPSQIKDAFNSGVQQMIHGGNTPETQTGLEGGMSRVVGAVNAISSPLAPVFSGAGNAINKAGQISENISEHLPGSSPQQVQDFSKSSVGKTTARVAEDVGNLSTLASAGVGFATMPKPSEIISKGSDLISKGKETLVNAKNDITNSIAERQAKADTAKIQENISPKPTVKQAKLAQSEGRLIPGKEPTLFKSGTEGKIIPSQKTINATETIQKNIPGAAKMNPNDLYSALDRKITETATKLRPQMEATPIKPETIQKINEDWSTLKKQQMADAPATEEPNVAKRQAKFESLLQKSGSETHADLWDTAIKYDQSIPDAVKRANSMSSESLQLQKDEWLQNRQILSDAIGKNEKPEFKTMSDMYEAQNGLNSKAVVDKAQMSKINQFLKDHPKVSAALGGATIYEIAKHLGIPLP